MSINLVESFNTNFPQVPGELQKSMPELYDFLIRQQLILQQQVQGLISNDSLLQSAINKGVSGSLVIASGGHILVTSGIVTAVTTT